ncbi:MAG: TolC family protein [Nautiliaceae bacterium]
MNKWKMENGKWKILLMFFPLMLNAENFTQIKSEITNSLKYKMQKKKIEIFEEKLNSIKAKNYGSLDLEYSAVHLFKQPVMKMDSMQPVGVAADGKHLVYQSFHSELPMADKNHFTGVLKYSYPLFTGFAITNMIEKSKLEVIKEKINLENVKRVLTLNAAKLYSNIYALKAKINALEKAKAALLSAKEKAESFYKEGLLNKASVDDIDAKYYEIVALIKETKAQKNSLINLLSYLINKKISKIDGIKIEKNNLPPKFENRPDVKAIKETLKIKDKDIKLAKSKYYPQIGLEAGIKREADNIVLTDNDYQNIDKSYIALGVKYNLFDGGEKKATLQMAKLAKTTQMIYYNDYLNQVKTEYQNDLDTINALFMRLKAAKEEIKARESYYEYIRAKFEEGLKDSSDLNDAIAKLAEARAKKEAIKAQIFFLNVKLKLNGGYDE